MSTPTPDYMRQGYIHPDMDGILGDLPEPFQEMAPAYPTQYAYGGPDFVLQNPEVPASNTGKIVKLAGFVGSAAAMAVSYKRNKSIPWAFASGLVWPAYLVYTLVLDRD